MPSSSDTKRPPSERLLQSELVGFRRTARGAGSKRGITKGNGNTGNATFLLKPTYPTAPSTTAAPAAAPTATSPALPTTSTGNLA
jgi:hypothetical protein